MIPPGRVTCLRFARIPVCCVSPQKPWEGDVPPAVEIGQWRRWDPTRPLSQQETPFCRVSRQDDVAGGGLPTFEVELWDASIQVRNVLCCGARYIMTTWPEALPRRPSTPEPPPPGSSSPQQPSTGVGLRLRPHWNNMGSAVTLLLTLGPSVPARREP